MGHRNAFTFKWVIGAALVLVVGLLFTITRPVVAPAHIPLTSQDEILIYQAVIQSITPPDASGPRYVLRSTDDWAAQSPQNEGNSNQVVLSSETQAGINAAMSNIIWIDRKENVPRDPLNLRVAQGGVIITLGNISMEPGRQVKTSAGYFAGPTWGGGYVFTFTWTNGVWSISSMKTNWIS